MSLFSQSTVSVITTVSAKHSNIFGTTVLVLARGGNLSERFSFASDQLQSIVTGYPTGISTVAATRLFRISEASTPNVISKCQRRNQYE